MSDKPFIDPHAGKEVRPHPAKFSDVLLAHIQTIIPEGVTTIIDPMAGVGKIVQLGPQYTYLLNELEPEWASQIDESATVTVGDAKDMVVPADSSAMIITSPPYGNRMADYFISETKPDSMKGRYAGDLGRRLSKESTAAKRFGDDYTSMMEAIYTSLFAQMVTGQYFLLNVSNFIRSYEEVNVNGFYLDLFTRHGFALDRLDPIVTPRDRGRGANANLRVNHEVVMLWRKL